MYQTQNFGWGCVMLVGLTGTAIPVGLFSYLFLFYITLFFKKRQGFFNAQNDKSLQCAKYPFKCLWELLQSLHNAISPINIKGGLQPPLN